MGGSIARPGALPWRPALLVLALFLLFALIHPIDHDESQYVAAAVLSAHGLLPYRDYAYLQTPLQPVLFAPIAWAAGGFAWPALRLVNAVLGMWTVGCVWRAARAAGAGHRAALVAAGLLASCDILLFSSATARNDALPAALLATALIPIARGARDTRAGVGAALLVGLLLAAAAAAKISYALPAAAYGLYALVDRRQRPAAMVLGAVPVLLFVAWRWAMAPDAFVFDALHFPALAPAEFYGDRPWKLSLAAKAVDTLKFLALGPALLALVVVGARVRRLAGLEMLVVAGLIAAVLPTPIWRQYLLPVLPPVFVLLALAWDRAPPRRATRILAVCLVCAGLASTAISVLQPQSAMAVALAEGRAIRAGLDRAGVGGTVATLSPQFLAASGRLPDPRFATGPFYFRSRHLLAAADEARLHLVARDRLALLDHTPPAAVLVGGEGAWSSGDAALDRVLERWAREHDYRAVPLGSARFRLYVAPR